AAVAAGAPAKRAANWVINDLLALVGDARRLGDADVAVPAAALAGPGKLGGGGTPSGQRGQGGFAGQWGGRPPPAGSGRPGGRGPAADIVAKEGLAQVSDGGELEAACRKVIAAHPDEAGKFKSNPKLMGFFVGAVMKETGGKGNPKAINEILRKLLG